MKELFELLPGRTYVIESEQHLSEKVKTRLLDKLKEQTKGLHCKFLILDGGLKLARAEPEEDIDDGARVVAVFVPSESNCCDDSVDAIAYAIWHRNNVS